MALTRAQLATLAAHIRANQDAAVVAALTIRNDSELARLYNLPASPATSAWMKAASAVAIFEATDLARFDNVSAGRRESWRMLQDFAPHDFGNNKRRNAVVEIWSAQTLGQRNAVLSALTENATLAEVALGGQTKTSETGGVTALDRNWAGVISIEDVGVALNDNP